MTMLPPSLAVIPNIPVKKQTKEQLVAERDYWQQKLDSAESWGGALTAVLEFRDECQKELNRRFNENIQ